MPYKNPEMKRIYNAQYNLNNRDKINANKRKNYQSGTKIKESNAKWRESNRELERNRGKRNYDKNKTKTSFKNSRRNYRLISRYGISIEEYDLMLEGQGGVCAICKNPPPEGKMLDVDHNHKTGKVRKLLCRRCNVVIGNVNEDEELLQSMIDYLVKGKETLEGE